MSKHEIITGADTFFQSFCIGPVQDLRAALLKEERLSRLSAGDHLCRKGDPADCVWIIESGRLDIKSDQTITSRGRGALIGEASFFRVGAEAQRRGANVVAGMRSEVWKIDRSMIDALSTELKLAWTEALARVLVEKLDESLDHRVALTLEADLNDDLIKRFVCPEGIEAAHAAVRRGSDAIPITRKKVIAWFCDIAGFSYFSEGLPPDEVAQSLRRVMDPIVEEIIRQGGQVDKIMGDGLMAFWLCHDEARLSVAADKAVWAAIESANRVAKITEDAELPLDIRIGLHVGEAAVGNFGGHDRIAFTLIGDTVNSASRYEQHRLDADAPCKGRVRISNALWSRLSDSDLRARFNADPIAFYDKHGRQFVAYLSNN